jgi:PTS system fructose-specific IIA component/PTS system nitrogen regulatory IIA component
MPGFVRVAISDTSIRTKERAISAILDRLVEVKALSRDHRQGVLAAILKREQLGSTGIGRGVAIPHAKFRGVNRSLGAIATFPEGVQFDSVDREPVRVICLIVSPVDRPGDHLRLLETLSRRLRIDG